MEDRTYQVLLSLAERLGTTIEHLWAVLIKQAVVTGMTNVVILAAVTTAACYLTRIVRIKVFEAAYLRDGAWAGVSFMWAFIVLLWVYLLPDTVAAIFNPEFWALKQVLTALR